MGSGRRGRNAWARPSERIRAVAAIADLVVGLSLTRSMEDLCRELAAHLPEVIPFDVGVLRWGGPITEVGGGIFDEGQDVYSHAIIFLSGGRIIEYLDEMDDNRTESMDSIYTLEGRENRMLERSCRVRVQGLPTKEPETALTGAHDLRSPISSSERPVLWTSHSSPAPDPISIAVPTSRCISPSSLSPLPYVASIIARDTPLAFSLS